ncbi:MAG: hypothetical protein FWH26_06815 [Oscillospiraceae bacterium]|nr:hypothetical protein [Oscillospiraceae bacterium]
MMKKTISILLALCLICAFGVTVFAVDLDKDNPVGNTVISTVVEPSYTVLIPAALSIPFGNTSDQVLTIEASSTDFRIHAGEQVDVSVSTANGVFALSNGTHNIAYAVKSPGVTAQNDIVAIFTAAGQAKTVNVAVSDWTTARTAGTYSQSLIFTLAYSGAQ